MEQLSREIREAMEDPIIDIEKHLRETAKKWASYVIQSNDGEALKKGLEISKAIADYLNEIEIQDKDS